MIIKHAGFEWSRETHLRILPPRRQTIKLSLEFLHPHSRAIYRSASKIILTANKMVTGKALVTRVANGKARLELEEIPLSNIPDNQVLVRLQAVAQNPTDGITNVPFDIFYLISRQFNVSI